MCIKRGINDARMRIYNEYTKVALLQALIIKEKILQNWFYE